MSTALLVSFAGKLLVAGFLVLLNGFFVAAELALVKIRETQSEIFITVSWDVPVKTFLIDKTVTYRIEVQRNFSR